MSNICCFIEKRKKCTNKAIFPYNFCKKHSVTYEKDSNVELLLKLAQASRDCLTITADKKIGASQNLSNWEVFTNLFNAMVNRGYTHEELKQAISDTINNGSHIEDLLQSVSGEKKWRKFERLVEAIHFAKADGAKIIYDEKITGKRTSRERQVDISVRFDHLYYTYFLAIECKDYKSPVPISEVESFITKLEDIGADKGIMVSSNGFQLGAVETAKSYGVELFTLEENKSDWASSVRDFSISFPFPEKVEFDHSPLPNEECINYSVSQPIDLDDMEIYRKSDGRPTKITSILKDVCEYIHNEKIDLPVHVVLKLDPGYTFTPPGRSRSIEIKGLKIDLIKHNYSSSHKIDMPPSTISYKYTDVIKKISHTLSASDVSKNMRNEETENQ